MTLPTFAIENKYWQVSQAVVGLDEAGRGCLAGPVFAAAVIFPVNFDLKTEITTYVGNLIDNFYEFQENEKNKKRFNLISKIQSQPEILINDSKVLDALSREIAFNFIINNSKYCISNVNNDEIDRINILQASQLAFRQALDDIELKNEHILVDGNYFKGYKNFTSETVIKGDSKSLSIAAASILAKVSRDRYMSELLHNKFPEYGFNKHFGYATKQHFEAIEEFGETEFHRKSFLKKYENRKKEISQQLLF